MRISDWSSDVCSSDLCTRTQEILLIKTQQGHLRECITIIRLDAQRLAEIMLGQRDVLVLDADAGIGPHLFRRRIMRAADHSHEVSARCINLATDRKSVV